MTERGLTVASYNVHRCVGLDGRFDPERTAAVIRELDADVVALQEVDRGFRPGHQHLELEHLGGETGYSAIPGPNLVRGDGDYGNGLLTRHPVVAVRHLDLSVPRCEPRGAIDADIAVDGAVVRVIATHLGLLAWERRIQIGRLLKAIGDPGKPLVVAGDFNEWHPWSASLRMLIGRLGRSPAPRTFPSFRPLLSLDRIFALPAHLLVDTAAHATKLARRASDHLPVRARLAWPRPAG